MAAIAVAPALARAQAATTITACYVPKTGSVYRIKAPGAPDACKTSHVEFSWKAPVVAYGEIITVTTTLTVQPGKLGVATAHCPDGSVVISGGFVQNNLNADVNFQVRMSDRHPSFPGWRVNGYNYDSVPAEILVEAYCAPISK
jgi:hypothetical protein